MIISKIHAALTVYDLALNLTVHKLQCNSQVAQGNFKNAQIDEVHERRAQEKQRTSSHCIMKWVSV